MLQKLVHISYQTTVQNVKNTSNSTFSAATRVKTIITELSFGNQYLQYFIHNVRDKYLHNRNVGKLLSPN